MKQIISLALALTLSGCLNIQGHSTGSYKPYESTVGMSHAIVEAFVEKPEWHSGSVGEAGIAHAFSIILLPVAIIALPIEAVADTVTLPYDLLSK